MPAPDQDFILAPVKTALRVALEPAQNALNSLLLLNRAEGLSGLDEWVTRTLISLTPAQQHTNRVVLTGLYYAITPTRSWPSFPAYVDNLERQNPQTLRDRVFAAYFYIASKSSKATSPLPEMSTLLASQDTFLDFLLQHFSSSHIDEQVEGDAYQLLKDPPAMQTQIVSHLRAMWNNVLAAEWERTVPTLQTCVEAFRQIDFRGLSPQEAAERVIGKQLPEKWACMLEKRELETMREVVFVPSAHLGPYLGKFITDQTFWLLFGARQPEGVERSYPDLSRSELLVRLNALADDTRIRILRLLAEKGELCSPEIMDELNLSQSAASRHLKQLSANGYITERRRENAKCYSLNQERIENSLSALSHFLLG